MSDRQSQNWNEALQWIKAEAERLGWVTNNITEDLETRTIEGKINLIHSTSLREDGVADFVFYVEPVRTFKITGPSGCSGVETTVLRDNAWFRVYHENSMDREKTFPLRKVLGLKDPERIMQFGFGSQSVQAGYYYDWWVHFLKLEAEDLSDDEERLREIRRLIDLHGRD